MEIILVLLFGFISGTCAYGDYCTVNGVYKYCSDGCCGQWYDQYCCLDEGVGRTIGIVIGCICGIGAIITVLVIILCCCRRARGASGTVMSPQPTTTMATTVHPGVPMAAPTYPGTYPVGQQNMNFAYNQPYLQQPSQLYQPAGYSQPYPQYTAGGHENVGFSETEGLASAPPNDPDIGKPPPYSEVQ